jgi:putative ABC transport system permease protein
MMHWWFFVGSAVAALLIAWLTVGIQTLRAAGANPIRYLRSEKKKPAVAGNFFLS